MAIANYADSFPVDKISLSDRDYFNLNYLISDNFEWSTNAGSLNRNYFPLPVFRRKAAFYSATEKDFNLVVNPVLNYQMSTEKFNGRNVLLNNRGIEIRGNVGKNIGFYTQVSDEIFQPYSWVAQQYAQDNTLMYANFVKSYPGYLNYFLSSAYVTASLNRYMDLQFGHTRNFIGDGYRTFILGDNQPEYLNMRLNTRIWKLNYTNIWAELRDRMPGAYTIQNRHYMATHHLGLNLGKNFNLGMFETILFQRDSGYTNTGFDPNYLNPVIFYKSVENGLNSTDKAILGINWKYNFLKHFSHYGQGVISEFVMKEMLAGKGWWGNKYAWQLGLKYINVAGVRNLDLQIEYNYARPFMYTSYSARQTLSNFGQPLAHPLGANFKEMLAVVRYQPAKRWFITAKVIMATYGNDTNGSNVGKDIRMSYNTNTAGTYGNFVGQGALTRLTMADLLVSFMPSHNFFIDLKLGMRLTESDYKQFETNASYGTVGVRWNLPYRNYDF